VLNGYHELSAGAREVEMPADLERPERLQIMLNAEELAAVDDFRFQKRMPSRAAAVRELMKRGLSAEGFSAATAGVRSTSFGVLGAQAAAAGRGDRAGDHDGAHTQDNDESMRQPADRHSRS
jgi:hypothetical protein